MRPLWNSVQGISVIKSFNMCEKNVSEIENAYEKNADSAYEVESVFYTAEHELLFGVSHLRLHYDVLCRALGYWR